MFCGLYGSAFPGDVAHRTAGRKGQRGLLPRRPAVAMAGGGLRHDRRFALGCHVHVGARRRLQWCLDLYAAGAGLCARLCGDRAGAAAALLQAQPHIDLHLPRPALRCPKREDGGPVFHHKPPAGVGAEDVPGGVRALRVCVPRLGRALLGAGGGVYRHHPALHFPRRYQDGGVDRHAADHFPAGRGGGYGGGRPQQAGHEPAGTAAPLVRPRLYTYVRDRPDSTQVLGEAVGGRHVHHHYDDGPGPGHDAEEPHLPHAARRAEECDW